MIKQVIYAEIEAQYGVPPMMTADDAIVIIGEPSFKILSDFKSRDVVKSYAGKLPGAPQIQGQEITFSTEYKGSGTAGTVPRIGRLLRGCGFNETISSGVSVGYSPVPVKTGESITINYFREGIVHKMTGCTGKAKLNPKVNEFMLIEFTFTGLYAGPVQEALPAVNYESSSPHFFRNANFKFDNVTDYRIESLQLEINNTINKSTDANAMTGISGYNIGDREIKGSIDPEISAAKNFFSLWENGASVAMSFEVGQTGNKCKVSCPAVQIETAEYGNRENANIQNLNLLINPVNGNDEIVFLFS